MRVLTPCLLIAALNCARTGPPDLTPGGAECVLPAADSVWLTRALSQWRHIGEPLLRLEPRPFPPLILFDTRCAYNVNPVEGWQVTGSAHGGTILLPNGRPIQPIGVGITSPTSGDSGVFLAIALPAAWRADPRYGASETRAGWERYLVGAFAHEMTHARMLPYLLPRLRMLEAAIYPDTIEDNAIQNRFGDDRAFTQSIQTETELLYQAAVAPSASMRAQYVRTALALMRERWDRYYVGDLAKWSELEQVFLDLEGIAQWTAFNVRWGRETGASRSPGSLFDRLLRRFRDNREFWSEDQGLLLIIALDEIVPDWQRQLLAPGAPTAYELLSRAVQRER